MTSKPSLHPLRAAAVATALMIGIGLVVLLGAVHVTSQPQFCRSCHIMKPYYQSWRHSTHKKVACVECHIAPGFKAEVRKKYEALSMVAKYFTGTYGTNPWAQVEDAACLRCHERQTLGKSSLHGIPFDHAVHLAEVRGKKLRCASCHSQNTQESHIAVSATTCILCHFKGVKPGTGTAQCLECHSIPKGPVKAGAVTFDHADAARFHMECVSCHGVQQPSDGAVPRERCLTCHNTPSALAQYGNSALLHRKHIAEHKVECLYCHLHIQHVEPVHSENAVARIQSAASQCQSCHETGHSPQLSLYTGTGGRGVPSMPSAMFQAGVRCEGCHFSVPGHAAIVDRASDVSCTSCHGASYRRIYESWVQGSESRSHALRRQMDETTRALGASGGTSLTDAQFNLGLVERGHGVHNIEYTYALLRRSWEDMNAARRTRGLGALPRPWNEAVYSSPCLRCHEGIETQSGAIFGRTYAHKPHVVGAKLLCESCHRTHEEKVKGEVVRYDASGCEACHHSRAKADCMTCHVSVRQHAVKSSLGSFDHAMHIDDAGQTCADCHDVSVAPPRLKQDHCKECHES